jgi:hypothetical protein
MVNDARDRVDRFDEVLNFCNADTALARAAVNVRQHLGYIEYLLGTGSALASLRTYRLSEIEPVGSRVPVLTQKLGYAVVDSTYESWRFAVTIEPGNIQPNMGLTDSTVFYGAVGALEQLDTILYNKLIAYNWNPFESDSTLPHLYTFILESERAIRMETMLVGMLVVAAQHRSGRIQFEVDASVLPAALKLVECYGILPPADPLPLSKPPPSPISGKKSRR